MNETESVKMYFSEIRKIKLFKYLTEEEAEALLNEAEIIHYKEGEKIISQGEISHFLFVILKGNVNVFVVGSDKEDIFICRIREGEVFGESAVFTSEDRTADVISSENTTVLRLNRSAILSFIKKDPRGGNKLLMLIINSLLNKLRDANMEIVLEKQSHITLEDIGPIIREIIEDDD